MSGWQPIESAPRDGSWFLTCNANAGGEYEIARYAPQYWNTYQPIEGAEDMFTLERTLVAEFDSSNFHRATHWLAVPPTPSRLVSPPPARAKGMGV